MNEPSDPRSETPLPRKWLPDPHPADGDPAWETRIERIMAAATLELRRLGTERAENEFAWWSGLSRWWQPAMAAAAASIALLALVEAMGPRESARGSVALGLVASAGDPVTVWKTLGIDADPVLALIAIQEPRGASQLPVPPTVRDEDPR